MASKASHLFFSKKSLTSLVMEAEKKKAKTCFCSYAFWKWSISYFRLLVNGALRLSYPVAVVVCIFTIFSKKIGNPCSTMVSMQINKSLDLGRLMDNCGLKTDRSVILSRNNNYLVICLSLGPNIPSRILYHFVGDLVHFKDNLLLLLLRNIFEDECRDLKKKT